MNDQPVEKPEEEQQDGLPTEPDPPPPPDTVPEPKAARKSRPDGWDQHDATVIKDRKSSPKAKRTNSPPHGFPTTTLIVE